MVTWIPSIYPLYVSIYIYMYIYIYIPAPWIPWAPWDSYSRRSTEVFPGSQSGSWSSHSLRHSPNMSKPWDKHGRSKHPNGTLGRYIGMIIYDNIILYTNLYTNFWYNILYTIFFYFTPPLVAIFFLSWVGATLKHLKKLHWRSPLPAAAFTSANAWPHICKKLGMVGCLKA